MLKTRPTCSGRLTDRAGAHLHLFVALCLVLGTTGCLTEVPFYEREAFADAVMRFDSDAARLHFRAKTLYSMEGSIGGVGTSGGGGCGCY